MRLVSLTIKSRPGWHIMKNSFKNCVSKLKPVGFSLVIATVLNMLILAIALLSAPVTTSVDFYFTEAPPQLIDSETDLHSGLLAIEADFPDCFRMPLDEKQANKHSKDLKNRLITRIRCSIPNSVKSHDDPRSVASLAGQFSNAPGWTLENMSVRVENQPPGLGALIWLAPVLVATLWPLLRGLNLQIDLKRATCTIRGRPWILLATPAAALAISSALSLVIAPDPVKQEHAVSVLTDMAPPLWLLVFVLPLIEEAVFRQWLYVRIIDRLPVWLAAGASSWAFMLLHVFNPQYVSLAVYLPTVFGLGMTLFWIRHRFQSFSLAAIAHIANNGLFLGLSTLRIDW